MTFASAFSVIVKSSRSFVWSSRIYPVLNGDARTLNRQQTSAACQLSDTIGDNAVKWSLLKEGLFCTYCSRWFAKFGAFVIPPIFVFYSSFPCNVVSTLRSLSIQLYICSILKQTQSITAPPTLAGPRCLAARDRQLGFTLLSIQHQPGS